MINEEYYVIEDSNSDSNYVKLLKAKSLTVQELFRYGKKEDKLFINKYVNYYANREKIFYEYGDDIGGMSYYTDDYCSSMSYPYTTLFKLEEYSKNCKNNYDISDVKKLLDSWSQSFGDDLVTVQNNKVTILTIDDMIEQFNYNLIYYTVFLINLIGYIMKIMNIGLLIVKMKKKMLRHI